VCLFVTEDQNEKVNRDAKERYNSFGMPIHLWSYMKTAIGMYREVGLGMDR
jgi:hypothetical protein